MLQRLVPTLGDEQIRDFDLDKNTVFKAPILEESRIQPSWDIGSLLRKKGIFVVSCLVPSSRSERFSLITDPPNKGVQGIEGWEKLLRELAKKFPMTMMGQ